jgi:hypothetical protein
MVVVSGYEYIGKLCSKFNVTEETFVLCVADEKNDFYGKLPDVTRMLPEELQGMPEYGHLCLLADLKKKRSGGSD